MRSRTTRPSDLIVGGVVGAITFWIIGVFVWWVLLATGDRMEAGWVADLPVWIALGGAVIGAFWHWTDRLRREKQTPGEP